MPTVVRRIVPTIRFYEVWAKRACAESTLALRQHIKTSPFPSLHQCKVNISAPPLTLTQMSNLCWAVLDLHSHPQTYSPGLRAR